MERIEWDAALETGDPTVDSQHQELVGMLNRLLAEEAGPDAAAVIPETLERLSAYVSTHFACEQELMEQHGLPAERMEVHLEEHRQLTERTRRFVLDYRAGDVGSVESLVRFLIEWLRHHIEHVDREFIDFVRGA